MIVLAETNNGTKKCFIRDKIFMEVDENNRRIPNGVIRSSNIKNILWLEKGKAKKIPTADFLKLAEEKDMFGLE